MLTAEELFGELYKKDDPIFSLKSFATATNNNDRETYPRVLDHILHTEPNILFKDYNEILKTIDIVANDKEVSVRANLSSWLVKICSCLPQLDQNNCTVFGCFLLDRILKIILKYMSDEVSVRTGAFKTLIYLIEHGFLDKNTVEQTVCPVIVQLSKLPITSFDEDIHTNVIYMMTKIAPIIGYIKTYELLYEKFVELSLDKTHFVRKQCATAFPVMCEVLGENIFETNMLPIFMKLCDDEVWSVRRACAEVMPKMALLCTLENRRKYLVPAVKKFMFDPSQWVIMTALKNLGQFLTTFAQLRILGLAYDYRLELFITNAADQEFRQKFDAKMLLYSNQPNSETILNNFESYERMFEASIIKYGLASLSIEDTAQLAKDFNIDKYLTSIISPELKSGRLSITSDSDDGGISKISDFPYKYYVYHQKPIKSGSSSTSSSSSASASTSPLYNNPNYDETNPLTKFFKYCAPLKNNFLNSSIVQNYEYSDDDEWCNQPEKRGGMLWSALLGSGKSDKQKFNDTNDLKGSSSEFSPKKFLNDLVNDLKSNKNNNNEEVGTNLNKKSVYDLSKFGLENENNNNDTVVKDDFDGEDEDDRFNSHQFWYISPELPLDLDFIDNESGDAHDDTMNNNTSTDENVNLSTTEENESTGDIFYSKAEQQRFREQQQSVKESNLADIINWENEEVEWNLLEDFVYMKDINDEMCYECAYNFPAVILTFGKKFWPIMHKHFIALCNDLQNSVRKTMAASISKIALIIGPEQATRDLVIPYIEFFKDADEIKIEVVKSLTEFVRVVDSSEHEILISQLELCLTAPMNPINWRFRETIALQVKELVRIHAKIKKENCLLYLAGLALKLMHDRYDCVRKAGIEAFVWCCHYLQANGKLFKFFADNFAAISNWRKRQTYIITADKLLGEDLLSPELFKKYMLDIVLKMANDLIPNVRILAARCLTKTILPHPYFNDPEQEEYKMIKKVIQTLETDEDRDVRDNSTNYHSQNQQNQNHYDAQNDNDCPVTLANNSHDDHQTTTIQTPTESMMEKAVQEEFVEKEETDLDSMAYLASFSMSDEEMESLTSRLRVDF